MESTMKEAYPSVGKAMMKRTIVLLGVLAIAFALLFAFNSNATAAPATPVYVSGNVSGTWSSGNVYYVTGNITILAGQTLNIQPGTLVYVNHETSITVNGTLNADASTGTRIQLSANNSNPVAGYWDGLMVNEGGVANVKNVEIWYADVGVYNANGTATVANSKIFNATVGIVYIKDSVATNIVFDGVQIVNYTWMGIEVYNPDNSLTVNLNNTSIMGVEDESNTGLLLWAPDEFTGDVTLTMTNVNIDMVWSGVRVVAGGAVDIEINGLTLTNYPFAAIDVQSYCQGITFSIVDSELAAYEEDYDPDGILLTAANDLNGTIMVTMDGVTVQGGLSAIDAFASVDVSMEITECNFLGQMDVAVTADSIFGYEYVTIVDSVIDGSSALDAEWVYTIDQIPYEFELIPRDYNSMNQTDEEDILYVELPWEFTYAGEEFTELYMSIDLLQFGVDPDGVFALHTDEDEMTLHADTGSSWYGFMVYDDRAVFQWSVYVEDDNIDSEYILNIYEIVLFPNGDIQINYNMMEYAGEYVDNGYVGMWAEPFMYMWSDFIGSAFTLDYTSYLIHGEALSSNGLGLYVNTLVGDVEISITGSEISHFALGAIYASTEEGWMDLQIIESNIGWIYNWNDGVAIELVNSNGTNMVAIEGNSFEYVFGMAFRFYSETENTMGAESAITIAGNNFNHVAYLGRADIYVYQDAVNDTSEYSMSYILDYSDNVLVDSGTFATNTFLYVFDDTTWEVSINEMYINNTSELKLYTETYPFEWPMGYSIYFPMFGCFDYINKYSDVGNLTVDRQYVATDNNVDGLSTILGVEMWRMTGFWTCDSITSNAENTMVQIENTIMNNTVYVSDDADCREIVDVDSGLINYEGNLAYTYGTEISGNSFTVIADDSTTDGIRINPFGLDRIIGDNEYAFESKVIEDVFVIENNYIEGVATALVYDTTYDAENMVGVADITEKLWFLNNEIVNCGYASSVDITTVTGFDDYFPLVTLWEGEDMVQTVNFDQELLFQGNDIQANYIDDYTIYVDTESIVSCPGNAVFAHPTLNVNEVVKITDNTFELASEEDYVGAAYVYAWFDADGRDPLVQSVLNIWFNDNVVTGGIESDGFWAEVYNSAETSQERDYLLDTPLAIMDATIQMNNNVFDGQQWPLWVDVYSEAAYGASSEQSMVFIESIDNVLNNVTEEGIGVELNQNAWVSDWSLISYNDTVNVEIAGNIMDDMWMGEETTGIYVASEFDLQVAEVEESGYEIDVIGTVNINIEENVIVNFDDGIWADFWSMVPGFEVQTWIMNNEISSVYDVGIHAGDGAFTIQANTITEGNGVGLEAEDISGSIMSNEISYMGDIGMTLDDCEDLVVSDNSITNCGIYSTKGVGIGPIGGMYVMDGYNLTIAGNAISDNEFGVYVEDLWDSTFEGNIVERNLMGGAMFYDVFDSTIEDNVFSDNMGDGVDIQYGDGWVFGNNTVERNMLTGVAILYSYDQVYLYNNMISYNGEYGLVAEFEEYPIAVDPEIDHTTMWYGLKWIVDDTGVVAFNDVDYYGEITVTDGGLLFIDNVNMFCLAGSSVDLMPTLLVEDGGQLATLNSFVTGNTFWEFIVNGAVDAQLTDFSYMVDVHVNEGSVANFRECSFSDAAMWLVHIDNSSPVFSECVFIGNLYNDDIVIVGANANPTIVGGLITAGRNGIYAQDTNIGGIYGNKFIMNLEAGINAESCDGKIHDNMFMLNKVAIMVLDSHMSIEDNEIGWTHYIDALTDYIPVLELVMHHLWDMMNSPLVIGELMPTSTLPTIPSALSIMGIPIESMLGSFLAGNVGVVILGSDVDMSGNTYGMLSQCVYAVSSQIVFGDTIERRVLTIPYFLGLDNSSVDMKVGNMRGLYAVDSTVAIDGAEITVLDDALVFEGCTVTIDNSMLNGGDYDIFAYSDTDVSVWNTEMDKCKAEDTSVITVFYLLNVPTVDSNGKSLSGIEVNVHNAQGELVGKGNSTDGLYSVQVVAYKITSVGKDASMNPYNVAVKYKNGEVSGKITIMDPVTTADLPAKKDNTPLFAGIIVLVAVIALIAAAFLLRKKK